MAERRMFSKSVIGSARFLRMPPSSRLLYYDLGMAADDDGVVEAFSVMRMTGAVEDDLKVLVSKGFITVLNEDLVAYIEDWSKNNQIRKDRYQPSIYQNLLVQIGAVNQLETVGQPDGNQRLTQDIIAVPVSCPEMLIDHVLVTIRVYVHRGIGFVRLIDVRHFADDAFDLYSAYRRVRSARVRLVLLEVVSEHLQHFCKAVRAVCVHRRGDT